MPAEAETKIRDVQAMSELAETGSRIGPRLKLIAEREARAEAQREGILTIYGDATAEIRVDLQLVFLFLFWLFLWLEKVGGGRRLSLSRSARKYREAESRKECRRNEGKCSHGSPERAAGQKWSSPGM